MSLFLDKILKTARKDRKKIVLPESDSPRILEAARIASRQGIAEIILLSDCDEREIRWKDPDGKDHCLQVINTLTSPLAGKYAEQLYQLRKDKGMKVGRARRLIQKPIYFGMMMLKEGRVDGLTAGAVYSTADTVRPALQIIKTAPGVKTASSMFFIIKEDHSYLFADCGLNRNPNLEELVEITFSTALTARRFGITPRIAFLSYSTKGSGTGSQVEKMRKAAILARRRLEADFPGNFLIDGELQFDAAFVPKVAEIKCPDSPLKGGANIFIFPNLDASNISYKLAQRLGGADAYGPILQGLNQPVNDLSRGCTVSDIVAAIAITAIQARKPER